MSLSNYPLGAEYDSNAPWNEEDKDMEVCPECGGSGGMYYDEDGIEMTKSQYDCLSKEEQEYCEFERCERCGGEGEIEVEPWEPDWDDYD